LKNDIGETAVARQELASARDMDMPYYPEMIEKDLSMIR
jgi:hypothetical protein